MLVLVVYNREIAAGADRVICICDGAVESGASG